MNADLARRVVAEAVGTGVLVLAIVGSAYMSVRLSPDDLGLQLFYNSIVTGAVLAALILVLQPVSGAHLNPVVTLVDVLLGRRPRRDVAPYVGGQVIGAVAGAIVANAMFTADPVQTSSIVRDGWQQWMGEIVATGGLVAVIFGLAAAGRSHLAAFAVSAWITGAYWFTISTSFANPAVTIGRVFSDNFSGIAAESVPMFVLAQIVGGLLALALVRLLWPSPRTVREDSS